MRSVIPQEDGTFLAEVIEFDGCLATADTRSEAIELLEEVAADWLETALEMGQTIPKPIDAREYSGKLVLRMAKSLHKQAALAAKREQVSLNQLIVNYVSSGLAGNRESNLLRPVFVTHQHFELEARGSANAEHCLAAPILWKEVPHGSHSSVSTHA